MSALWYREHKGTWRLIVDGECVAVVQGWKTVWRYQVLVGAQWSEWSEYYKSLTVAKRAVMRWREFGE
jgi:hypothetical protein